jgi:hypothetical protein
MSAPTGSALEDSVAGGARRRQSKEIRDDGEARPHQTPDRHILDKEAVITIAGKTIKVPAGAGSKGPDGPTLDVAPGKYPYKLKGAGSAGSNDPVEVGADEIWGLMIGPGGVLPLQMY